MQVDLVSDLLSGLRLSSTVFTEARFTAPWGFAKDRLQGAPFHVVLAGTCCVEDANGSDPVLLHPGDFIVLPHGDPHRLLHAPGAAAESFTALLAARGKALWTPAMRASATPMQLGLGGGGAETVLIPGIFAFQDHAPPQRPHPLIAGLPRRIVIRGAEGRALPWLAATMGLLIDEAASTAPGASAVCARLADILFLQAVRAHLHLRAETQPGWLRGLADSKVAAALRALHADPAADWTVDRLARAVAQSRSGLAARFQQYVGQPPMEYLTAWRMHLAGMLLRRHRLTLAAVATQVGYASETSFSRAFEKATGSTPARWRREAMDAARGMNEPSRSHTDTSRAATLGRTRLL